jgi:FdhD protein
MSDRPSGVRKERVLRFREGAWSAAPDVVATEEPLEIRLELAAGQVRAAQSLSVTMRTPGNDFELAAGFLFTEGVVRSKDDIDEITYCLDSKDGDGDQTYNVVTVTLRPWVQVDTARLTRNFYTTSSCGVCGKASLEAVRVQAPQPPDGAQLSVPPETLSALPGRLSEGQTLFRATGGIHAAWLCDDTGAPLAFREDVGRHNATDKLVGAEFLAGRTPLSNRLLVLSGRASFELLQKAAVAGIPFVAAVGAPSTLAVDLAREMGMTLVGFTRASGFNVYAGPQRIAGAAAPAP